MSEQRVSFLGAMIPAHVQDEMRQRVFPCPNQPPCGHSGLVHEIDDWDGPLPRCCEEGCVCGARAATATCRACGQTVTLLGGDWTDPDGCTNCMSDNSAVYAPHVPGTTDETEAGR